MKTLIKVLLKLLGIIFLYWFLISLIGFVILLVQNECFSAPEIFQLYSFFGIGFNLIINFIFSFALLIYTEKIMNLLKIKDENINFSVLTAQKLLSIGSKLIGLFIFVSRIGGFLSIIAFRLLTLYFDKTIDLPHHTQRLIARATSIIEIIARALPLIISVFLVFYTDKVINLINRKEKI